MPFTKQGDQMGWQTVPICDDHWHEEEPHRVPIRLKESVREPNEICYRCGRPSNGIFVRRNIPDANGNIIAACARCGKAVDSTEDDANVMVLGLTYDDVAVCILHHKVCWDQIERVYVPPRKSDGLGLIDAMDIGVVESLDDFDEEVTIVPRDRVEDA